MTNTSKLTPEELKQRMIECEAKYHASFETNSCAAIMKSYNELQLAKKQYYASIGKSAPAVEKDASDI